MEYTARESHRRVYSKDGRLALIDVDSMGMVEVSEELMDLMLRQLGYQEDFDTSIRKIRYL